MAVTEKALWASFESLPAAEQEILRIMSVVYEPTNQTDLQQLLRALGIAAGSSAINKQWREKMTRRQLIEMTGSKLRCQKLLCNALSYEAMQDGSFARIASRTDIYAANSTWMDNDFHYNPWRYKRRLRNALFTHDEQAFASLLNIKEPYAEPELARARILFELALPLVVPWFHGMPESFKYQLMHYYFTAQNLSLGNSRDGYELMQEARAAGELTALPSLTLLAEQALYRGDDATFDELAVAGTSYGMLKLAASKAFTSGDDDRARALFAQALAARKRETRKRIIHVEGIPGLLYCLALVKVGDAEAVKALDAQCKSAMRKDVDEPLAVAFRVLADFRALWDGRSTDHEALDAYLAGYLSRRYPLEIFVVGLAWHWLDKPRFPELETQLAEIARRAGDAHYPWFEAELKHLLGAWAGQPAEGLAAMMPRVESWERALDALANLAVEPAAPAPHGHEQDARLAWLVSRQYGEMVLEAREQKRRKNGGWTKGRPVALRRLAEETESLPFLSAEDMAICRCIRRDPYGYYRGGGQWYLPEAASLRAAVGHPRVFRADDMENPVAVVLRAPELLVKRTGEQVSITMLPSPDLDGVDVSDNSRERELLVVEGAGTIDLYEFDHAHLQIARILGGELKVPAAAEARVVESIVAISPLLTVHSDLQGMEAQAAEKVAADPRLHLNMQPMGDELKLAVGVQPFGEGPRFLPGAGGETVFAEIDGKRVQASRDLEDEVQRQEKIQAACPGLVNLGGGNWSFPDTEQALEGLLALQQMGDELVFAWPEGKRLNLHKEVGVSSASLNIRSHTNWFEVGGDVNIGDDEVLEMQKLLALIGESPGRFVQLGDNEFVALTDEFRRRLDTLRAIAAGGRVHGMAGLHLEELADGMSVTADDQWQAFKSRLEDAREIDPRLPATFEGELRDYQLAGFEWLCRLAAWGAGACLADDMGLGKTIQSLALILSRASNGPTLVIAPTSVCMNWLDEVAKFAPTINPVLFGAGDRSRAVEDLGPFDLLVCSYGLLASESELLTSVDWCTIVADEAQAFKNANTLRSKAVMKLAGEFRMITTGTPIENHLGELWNLFNFINPGLLGGIDHFNETFTRPIENGDADARQRLKQLISPFVLRRLKRDVLAELPPRTDIVLTVKLSKAEAAFYEALRREAASAAASVDSENRQRMIVLAQITRLRQAACNPSLVMPQAGIRSSKLALFGDVVSELLENGHRALVFSQFVAHLALVRDYLDEHDISYQYLDGSTRPAERKRAVAAFQAGEADLFLISLKAGGTGLNLTAANYVIHLDPWWNPAVEDQASDRAHRIGQQRPVTVYRLVTEDTIEQKIVDLHRRKRDLADSLLEGSDIGARLTLKDMLALIGR